MEWHDNATWIDSRWVEMHNGKWICVWLCLETVVFGWYDIFLDLLKGYIAETETVEYGKIRLF
jgi:hypothetical protein